MGAIYLDQGLYAQAIPLFKEALALPNDSLEHARTLLNIAQVYELENNPDSVNFYLDKALALHFSNPYLMYNFYLLKSKMAEKNNQYQEALNDYKEFYNNVRKVWDSSKNNELLEVQGKYDYEKLKNAENQLIIKKQRAVNILAVALLAAGVIIFLYYRRSAKNKRIMLETEQKIASLQKMADTYSADSDGFHSLLLTQFDILKKTALIKSALSENERTSISGQKLLRKFNEIVYGQDSLNWNKLYHSMDALKNGLYSKIHAKYPQLSEAEFRICCLSCEPDFSDKEIEIVLGTTLNMVRRIRSDVRKKIGMSKGEDFLTFFEKNL
jgi:hypothetical protein